MKKTVWILSVLLSASILLLSCQKAKEAEKKEIQMQGGQQPISAPIATGDIQASPLTEEEQKDFEKIGGVGIPSPNLFKTKRDALKYLKILIKGDVKTNRWYINYAKDEDVAKGEYAKLSRQYGDDICTAIDAVALKREEAFDLIIEVLNKKSDYLTAYACACRAMGWYAIKEGRSSRMKNVIPLLFKATQSRDTNVRIEAAGALLAVGESDATLPILSELAKQGVVGALVKLYEPEDRNTGEIHWTKLWDKRGIDILKNALDYPSDEIKAWSAEALAYLGIEKAKSESVALNILRKYVDRTEKDYGVGRHGERLTEKYLLSGYEGKDIDKLEVEIRSATWACWRAISAVGKLKSKEAVPLLKKIKEHNKGVGNICWENLADKAAEKALDSISEDAGGSK